MRTEGGDLAVSFTLTAREWRAGFIRQFRRSLVGMVLPVLGMLGIVVGAVTGLSDLIYFGVSCFLLLGLLFLLASRVQAKLGDRVQTMAFNAQGVYLADGEAETRSAWSLFNRFDETSDLFLLRLRNNRVVLVPKRAFDSALEVDDFRTLARSALSAP
ncbi:MAG: YcxB family protein [Acidimicrobiales bacterium]